MWVQENSIETIAAARKLTKGTVLVHIAKLIEAGRIDIQAVLPSLLLEKLEKAFENYTDESLTPLKEQHGDAFSYDELRMYKAFLSINSTNNTPKSQE
jgi:uncharacterized protein YpbB